MMESPDIGFLYTPLDVACEELQKRRQDSSLELMVHEHLQGDIPDVFRQGPVAVSTAHVATPNFALVEFHNKAVTSGLSPVVFEYLDDLFVTTNFDKASLAKMRFLVGGNSNDRVWHGRKIIDLGGNAEKKPLRTLRTLWNESFVEFHHRLLAHTLPNVAAHDGSAWYTRRGRQPEVRYFSTMALFIRHGILFENFLSTERERGFTASVVLPAFHAVWEYFGLKPLIVPITLENEEDRFWWGYQRDALMLIPHSNKSAGHSL